MFINVVLTGCAAVPVENLVMSEVRIEIPLVMLDRILNSLADARENAHELLAEHDAKLGRTIKKNRLTAEMYEQQIAECTEIIESLNDS